MSIELSHRLLTDIRNLLKLVYENDYKDAFQAVAAVIEKYGVVQDFTKTNFKHNEAFLFACPNALSGGKAKPLDNLLNFMQQKCGGLFTTLHLLPFCENEFLNSTTVIDFKTADHELGSFNDFARPLNFLVMADIELNHVSRNSQWLKNYLDEAEGYEDLFVTETPDFDYTGVYQDGHLPVVYSCNKTRNWRPVHLLSTLGEGVVDLNYTNYHTFVRMLDVILFYAVKNFAALRFLDAEYIWKDALGEWQGHYKSHFLLKIIRLAVDLVKPDIALAVANPRQRGTAFNYLGSGRDEMQLVYNEALPALLLHAMQKGSSRRLARWVDTLETGATLTSVLNVSASYGDIDLRAVEGILPKTAVADLVLIAEQNGGKTTYYQTAEGEQAPEKINVAFIDALRKPDDDMDLLIKRFMASQAIQATLPGIPAVYLHSLLGSQAYAQTEYKDELPNWVLSSHKNLDLETVMRELDDPDSMRSRIFSAYARLLSVRNVQPAFHPRGGFEVAVMDGSVFALKRFTLKQTVWTLTNTSVSSRKVSLDSVGYFANLRDLLTGREFTSRQIELGPYEFLWLEPLP